MTNVFKTAKTPGFLFLEVSSEDNADWTAVSKSMHVGNNNENSVDSYNNFIVETVPNDSYKSTLKIDLSEVKNNSPAEQLTIKLRKVQVCDDNGNNAYVFMLCSEAFEADANFNLPGLND
jgi:hypothetical protein